MSLRRETGFTVLEIAISCALGMLLLAGILATVVATYKAQVMAQRETEALNDASNTLTQLQRDLVGATALASDASCPTTCMAVTVKPPAGGADATIRHRLLGSQLKRDIWDPGLGAYINERVLTGSLANETLSPTVPLFACSSASGLLTVNLSLVVRPNPAKTETFRLNTTVRPRNTFKPSC